MQKTNSSIPEKQLYGLLNNAVPFVLFISHNRGGGVEKHIHELISVLPDGVDSVILKPASDSSRCVVIEFAGQPLLFFDYQKDLDILADFLAKIYIIHVHIHHTKGFSSAVLNIVTSLGVSWDYTVHDYYNICPQINLIDKKGLYCQELGDVECARCLCGRPSPGKMTIQEWRKKNEYFVEQAKRCFVPSVDVRLRMQRYFPDANYVTLYHEKNVENKVLNIRRRNITDRLAKRNVRVVVIGALTPMKGANLLETTAIDAKQRGLPVDFLLIGEGYRKLVTQPMSQLAVMGQYKDGDLQRLIEQSQADVVWFTACWPETYSYTLSAALVAGLPVVAPDIGSFQERLSQTLLSWIVPWNLTPMEFNDFFVSLRDRLQQKENRSFDAQFAGFVKGKVLPHEDSFNYSSDYIDSENIKDEAAYTGADHLFNLLKSKDKPPFNLLSFVKYRFLVVLTQLRTATLLSWAVRKVPQSFQTRLKGWLLGESDR